MLQELTHSKASDIKGVRLSVLFSDLSQSVDSPERLTELGRQVELPQWTGHSFRIYCVYVGVCVHMCVHCPYFLESEKETLRAQVTAL